MWVTAAYILSLEMGGNDLNFHTQTWRSCENEVKVLIRQIDLWGLTKRNGNVEGKDLGVLVYM